MIELSFLFAVDGEVEVIMPRTGYYCLICLTLSIPCEAGELPGLPELRLNFAAQSCVIITPQTEPYIEMAEILARALEEYAGISPQLASDTVDPALLGDGPLIILGNLMDNSSIALVY